MGEEFRTVLNRHPADVGDVLIVDEDVACFLAKTRAAAIRANRVAAVTAQKDADMQLVFLGFEIVEELANGISYESALLDRRIAIWRVERNTFAARASLEFVE